MNRTSALCWILMTASTVVETQADVQTWTGKPGLALLAPMADDICVDGDLAEWDLERTAVALDRVNKGQAVDESSVYSSMKARVAMQWSGQTLYVAASVSAGDVEGIQFNNLRIRVQPGGIGILAGRFPDKLISYLEPGTGSVQDGVFNMNLQAHDGEESAQPGLTYKTRKTTDGYDLEGAIDLSPEGWQIQVGDVIRIAASVAYHDANQEIDRLQKGRMVWRQWNTYRGSTAGYWGRLRLLDRQGLGLDLFSCAPPFVSKPLTVGGTADTATDMDLTSIRLRDSTGKIVAEKSMDLPMESGMRTTFRTTLTDAGVSAGTYVLEAVTEGDTQYASVAPIVVQSMRDASSLATPTDAPSHFYTEDPSRYRKFHLPIQKRDVSRNDYIVRAKALFEESMEIDFDAEPFNAWAWAHSRGMTAAILYQATGEERYAEYARRAWKSSLEFIKIGTEVLFTSIQMIDIMAEVMLETGLLTEQDEPEIREHIVSWAHKAGWGCYGWDANPWFRGTGHAALGPAVARGVAALKYPDVEDADFWTRYSDATVNDSLQYGDTIYNDSGYLHGWMWHISMYGHLSKRSEVFNGPQMKKTWERFLYWMHPMGAHPSLGDGMGWNLDFHKYFYVFEMLARHTRDGRYKWAAHRMFEYAENRIDGWETTPFTLFYAPWYYALAWYLADETIEEQEPDPASRVLTRKDLVPTQGGKEMSIGWLLYGWEIGPRDIPDKVIFKSGNNQNDFWAMVECCPITNHNQPGDTTSIICIADKTSVLLPSPVGRLPKALANHNRLYIADLSRDAPQQETESTTVPVFIEGEAATVAELHVENYNYLPVNVERSILFVKNRMMMVRDTARFQVPFFARVGPAFNHQNIGPERGETWSNSHVSSLFGLWEDLTQAWRNPVRDLLVYHAPRPETRLLMEETAQGGAGATWHNPLRVWYAWQGLPTQGQVEEFTTLLLPHDPVLKVAEWVEKSVTLAYNEPGQTLFRISDADHGEQELVLMNRDGKDFQFDDLETDASMLYLSATTSKVQRVFATDATFVKWQGETIARSDEPGLIERVVN